MNNYIKNNKTIDQLTLQEALKLMVEDQKIAISEIEKNLCVFKDIVNATFDRIKSSKNGRIIYCGAGTSGRIGVQDGVELNPTFGWPHDRVCFLIAGGEKALLRSIENAEDDIKQARRDVKKINVNELDVVICLAASGSTKFTKSVLQESKKRNALTIAIINNPKGKINNIADYTLSLDTGEEVVKGSTRLKAGTSQKVSLNIISTLLMTLFGFVREGEMINMIPTNEKLEKRKKRIQKKFKI
jgi:N-acetylmuramic acid 6-phosphate etherase